MATQLEILAEQFGNILLARNEYNYGDLYDSSNTGALSDGDDRGRGENNGSIGTKTDISERKTLQARNL